MKIKILRTPVILLLILLSVNAFGPGLPTAFAATGPDLIVSEISLSPPEPALGDAVTITVAVKNQGDSPADSSFVTCWVDDTIIATKPVDALDSGITATAAFSWTASAGPHIIKATADSSGKIAESDESNNTATYSITTVAPDLIVQSITWSPANPSKGDTVTFSITVTNQGNYQSGYNSLDFQVDGNSRGLMDVPAIGPGESVVLTQTWIALAGQHTLKAIVDVLNNVKEGDETNNELTVAFGTLFPDLIIEQITWTPENPSKDDFVSFNVTVANGGTGKADPSELGYYIDDTFITTIPVPAIEAGSSCNVTFSWEATLGDHKIRAVANYHQMVAESDETNNEMEVSLTTLLPDLIINDVTWSPAEPATGDNVTFTVDLKNQGSGSAPPSNAAFYIDGELSGYLNFPALEAGGDQSLTINWLATSGTHAINVNADYDKKVTESNEDNNTYYTPVSVASPDLIVSDITYSPQKPAIGDMVTLNATITNQGKGLAANFKVGYYLDNELISTGTVSSLPGGTSFNTTCTWKITNGYHTLTVNANDGNLIFESDESNNTRSISIAPNMPDLAITNVVWSPAEITPGQEIVFTFDVSNIGGVTAGASRLAYYVDGSIAGYNDIDSIAAGAKVTQSFTWAASAGQHSISIVADSKNQVDEIDETNNTVTVNIPPPDLIVENISYSRQNGTIGDTVTITASIMNTKGSRAPESIAGCYVDGISIGTKPVPALDAGESADVSFEWTAEPGTHSFTVRADINNTVMETDETNNEGTTAFTPNTPDLCVGNISWTTDNSQNSNEVNITVTIKNTGGCASGAFAMDYSFDGGAATSLDVPSIPGNGTKDMTFMTVLDEGEHTLNIVLDNSGVVTEADKTNNTKSFTFNTANPDLVIRSISWSPLTASIGDNITISAIVENQGIAKAVNPGISLTIDGIASGFVNIPEIDSNATASVDFTWKVAEGQHEIIVTADPQQLITESDRTNSSRSRTITFFKQDATPKTTPLIDAGATTGSGLLDKWWWVLLFAGAILGLLMLYTTIKNLRKR